MFNIRLWLIVVVLTAISWVVLKLIRKPVRVAWVFLFWVVMILGTTTFLYLVSMWFTAGPIAS